MAALGQIGAWVRRRGKVRDGSEDKSLWKRWAMSEDGVYGFDYIKD
jgi:hypothetical protein